MRGSKLLFYVLVMLFFVSRIGICRSISDKAASLAVFDLQAVNMEAMEYNSDIIYYFISEVEKNKNINILPRREMQNSLFQQGVCLSDNEEEILKAGKILGVNYLFFGNVEKRHSDGVIHAVIKLMDIYKTKVILKESIDFIGKEDIQRRVAALSDKIGKIVNGSGLVDSRIGDDDGGLETSKNDSATVYIQLRAESCPQGIRLSWQVDPPTLKIKCFYVYRSDNRAGPFRLITQVNDSEYVDSSILNNIKYYYRIDVHSRAWHKFRAPQLVSVRKQSSGCILPPIILKYQGMVRQSVIEFVANLENKKHGKTVEQYKIYRKKADTGDWKFLDRIKKNTNGDNDYRYCDANNLMDGTVYSYTITSVECTGDESEFSSPVSIKMMAVPELQLVRDGMLRSIVLKWSTVEGASGYRLYRKLRNESWKQVQKFDETMGCQYRDEKALIDGGQYTYHLTACDETGAETMHSNDVEGMTKALLCPPEQVEAQSGLVKEVVLRWKPVADEAVGGYVVYRQASGESFEKIMTIKDSDCNSYVDKGTVFQKLLDGEIYSYCITTLNLFKVEGGCSMKISARTKPRPKKVSGMVASADTDAIVVRWEKNIEPDIDHYTISRKEDLFGWRKIEDIPCSLQLYEDRDLKVGKTYQYSIFATDQDALEGEPAESEIVQSPILQ